MTAPYKPPLAVHLVWHPSDKELAEPIIEAISKHLSRDVDKPFSRNLNIPLFFYSSDTPNIPPGDPPRSLATRDILFIFTSVNTRGREAWNDYIGNLPCKDSVTSRLIQEKPTRPISGETKASPAPPKGNLWPMTVWDDYSL
uniref:Uncharacterized protein n=1 Tax=Candidatus Kentrum sp. DK TaxID=2126562 RepID=A0A450TS34_9GAMM|nr:MAG: hypothetical protein BECKDK2373B_GA0170837_13162 [Candidatus Kentron sp. DK]